MTEQRAIHSRLLQFATHSLALLVLAAVAVTSARAQDDTAPLLDESDLVDLVAPVALYPDDLLAIVLPATTYPLQVVEAQRLLDARESDPGLAPDGDWDDSVVALLNYPEALQLLNDDLDWTWQLGEAVLAQQGDVLEAVEVFRDQAWLAGNLRTDDYQTVERSDEGIEIRPAAQDVIYVPYYDPAVVVVRNPWPVYHYHPHAYPLYYYPYPVGHRFYRDWFWGVSTAFAISWRNNFLHLHYYDRVGHPFYGRRYLSNYFYRHRRALDHRIYRNGVRVVHRQGQAYRWHPRARHGARPGYRRYGARNAVTLGYDDRSARRGRADRAARINNDRRVRSRGVDNHIDRSRRNARRSNDTAVRNTGDRSRRDTARTTRNSRFAANGGDRSARGVRNNDRINRQTTRRNAVNNGARTQRFASGNANRGANRSTTRSSDRGARSTTRSRDTQPTARERRSNNRFAASTRQRQTTRAAPRAQREVRRAPPRRAQQPPSRSQRSVRSSQRAEPRGRSQTRAPARQANRSANRATNRASNRAAKRSSSRSGERNRRSR